MRRFEFLLVFAALFAVGWPAVFGVRTRRGIASGALFIAFLIHWRVEGVRWQMIPLYVTALGLAVGDVIVVERKVDWTSRIARGVFGVAGVVLAMVPALILPVPQLPVPSGPEQIGTVTFELVDAERQEIYGDSPGGPRRLPIQVWYPAEGGEGVEPTPWAENWEVVAPAMAELAGFPSFFLDQTRYTNSHAGTGLQVAPGTFPVVVYSHGWTGFRGIGVNQVETLVSHGYMVIAADHTFAASVTSLADGEVVPYFPEALPDEEEVGEEVYSTASQTLLEVLTGDLVAIINALESGVQGPFGALASSADLSRVGLYGHTAGGGAAISVCLQDERCDAVLGLDPWVEPLPDELISIDATRPALFMRSDDWRDTGNDAVLRGISERSEDVTYWVGVEGTNQSDFVVTPLLSPITSEVGLTGPIAAGRILPIVDRYLLGFFDVFLLETGTAALDTASFDEVSVEIIGR